MSLLVGLFIDEFQLSLFYLSTTPLQLLDVKRKIARIEEEKKRLQDNEKHLLSPKKDKKMARKKKQQDVEDYKQGPCWIDILYVYIYVYIYIYVY
jgi:hypothetical protein